MVTKSHVAVLLRVHALFKRFFDVYSSQCYIFSGAFCGNVTFVSHGLSATIRPLSVELCVDVFMPCLQKGSGGMSKVQHSFGWVPQGWHGWWRSRMGFSGFFSGCLVLPVVFLSSAFCLRFLLKENSSWRPWWHKDCRRASTPWAWWWSALSRLSRS